MPPAFEHYDLYGICRVSINFPRMSVNLKRLWRGDRVEKFSQACAEITVCANKRDMPLSAGQRSGSYKGIKWIITDIPAQGEEGRLVFFYSSAFVNTLFLRLVLLPLIKQSLIDRGGFSFSGSCFCLGNKTYVLFGNSGTGKTTLLLKALERGAEFVSDGLVMVLPGGIIRSFFEELELRHESVRRTFLWERLAFARKIQLALFDFISLATRRYVRFNIGVPPCEVNVNVAPVRFSERVVFVHLVEGGEKKRVSAQGLAEEVIGFEDWYRGVHGDIFYYSNYKKAEVIKQISGVLSNWDLWRMPAGVSLDEVIHPPSQETTDFPV